MAGTSTLPLYDRATDGAVTTALASWLAQSLSVDEITFRLRAEFDVKVSSSTVRRWLTALPTSHPKDAA